MLLSAPIACFNKMKMLILKKVFHLLLGSIQRLLFFDRKGKFFQKLISGVIICRVPMASLARREKVEKV